MFDCIGEWRKMEKIILIGNGGHAKSVLDSIEGTHLYEVVGFISNNKDEEFEYRGYKIIGTDNDLERIYSEGIHNVFICIGYMGNGNLREELYTRVKEIGYVIPTIIDESAIIATDAKIGEGTYVGKTAVVNSEAVIGKMTIINTGAIVEHNCIVGDFTHVSVGTALCGGVVTGKSNFIGAKAVVIQNCTIGNYNVIGAGAVVIDDIEDDNVTMGVPAKIVNKMVWRKE